MIDKNEFPPIRPGLLATEIHRQLLQGILTGRLKPGESLRDSVLAAQMQVSRSPVREALRLLEQSGLVTKVPNRSYVVITFDGPDLRELAALRLALETLAVRLLVEKNVDVGSFEDQLKLLRKAVDSNDNAEIVRSDRNFHGSIVARTGHSRLISTYEGLRDQIELAMISTEAPPRGTYGMVERHGRLSAELHRAVKTGDARPIVLELEDHILAGMGCPDLLRPLGAVANTATLPKKGPLLG